MLISFLYVCVGFFAQCADLGYDQDAPYRTTIMEPIGKMNAYFPIINEQISKRNKKARTRKP